MVHLICLDRDGTINKDDDYYLGSSVNWKEQVEFLSGVVEGIKLLNTLSDLEIFIITNQAGVAIDEPKFEQLTEERMHEVNKWIIKLLEEQGDCIKGYFACPFVDSKYIEKAKKRGWKINPAYIKDNHPDLKPNIGMIEKASQTLGKRLNECDIYVVGDRFSDVELGLRAGGKGILVPSSKTSREDMEKSREFMKENSDLVYITSNFRGAAHYIYKKLSES